MARTRRGKRDAPKNRPSTSPINADRSSPQPAQDRRGRGKARRASRAKLDVADVAALNEQLREHGLRIRMVEGDGNCLFRATADQLENNESLYRNYRTRVVDYIEANREHFEPFIDTDHSFEDYITSMRKDGTWAGNMELQALSMAYSINIVIHQLNTPRFELVNFSNAQTIHVSYHLGEHYNSVKVLSPDQLASSETSSAADLDSNEKKALFSRKNPDEPTQEEAIIMQSTNIKDLSNVREILNLYEGDMNATIEYFIAVQNHQESEETLPLSSLDDQSSNGPTLAEKTVMSKSKCDNLDYVRRTLCEQHGNIDDTVRFIEMERNIEIERKQSLPPSNLPNLSSTNDSNDDRPKGALPIEGSTALNDTDSLVQVVIDATGFKDREFIYGLLTALDGDLQQTIESVMIEKAVSCSLSDDTISTETVGPKSGVATRQRTREERELKKKQKEEMKRENNISKAKQQQQESKGSGRALSKKEKRVSQKQPPTKPPTSPSTSPTKPPTDTVKSIRI